MYWVKLDLIKLLKQQILSKLLADMVQDSFS